MEQALSPVRGNDHLRRRLEEEAGLRPQAHYRREDPRPFLAQEFFS
jgi:hypothetical protein